METIIRSIRKCLFSKYDKSTNKDLDNYSPVLFFGDFCFNLLIPILIHTAFAIWSLYLGIAYFNEYVDFGNCKMTIIRDFIISLGGINLGFVLLKVIPLFGMSFKCICNMVVDPQKEKILRHQRLVNDLNDLFTFILFISYLVLLIVTSVFLWKNGQCVEAKHFWQIHAFILTNLILFGVILGVGVVLCLLVGLVSICCGVGISINSLVVSKEEKKYLIQNNE